MSAYRNVYRNGDRTFLGRKWWNPKAATEAAKSEIDMEPETQLVCQVEDFDVTALEKAQHEFIDLFVKDVEEMPQAYKEMIRAQPGLWAMRTIAGLDESEVRSLLASLKAERRQLASVNR